MDSIREQFQAQIAAEPENLDIRLVYADWLTGRGDPRGQFISLQCALAGQMVERERDRLAGAERSLRQLYGARWLAEVGLRPGEGVFNRGFVETVRVTADRLPAVTPHLTRIPIRDLRIRNARGAEVGDVLHRTARYRLRHLELTHCELADDQLDALASGEKLPEVSTLTLFSCGLSAAGMKRLTSGTLTRRLTDLSLWGNKFGDEGIDALCDGDWPVLQALTVAWTGMGEVGAMLIADAPWRGQLTSLDTCWNEELGGAGVRTLCESLSAIEHLYLAGCRVDMDGVEAVCEAEFAGQLHTLNLRSNDSSSVVFPLERGDFDNLCSLYVGQNELRSDDVDFLDSDTFAKLERLGLEKNQIDEVGARALACNLWLGQLQMLDMGENPIGDRGVSHLLASQSLASITDLRLSSVGLTCTGAHTIANSVDASRLRRLELSCNEIADDGVLALCESQHLDSLERLNLQHMSVSEQTTARLRSRWDADDTPVSYLADGAVWLAKAIPEPSDAD